MNRFLFAAALASMCSIGLSACATQGESDQQQLEVHAMLAQREVSGVGCLLANDLGRWSVVAPGRVTVARSSKPLAVDCRHETEGSARAAWTSEYDPDRLIGKAAISAGLGNYVGRHSRDGFSYPSTLTVSMHGPKDEDDAGQFDPGTPLF